MFGRATITLGIGPHSSLLCVRRSGSVFCDRMVCLRRHVVYLFLCVSVGHAVNEFDSRYLVEGFSARDEIWQLDRGGLAIRHHPDL